MLNNSDQRLQGRVVSATASRDYGFITCDDRSIDRDAFYHVSDIVGADHLSKGEKVSFRLTTTPKGYRARLIQREI